MIFQNIIRTLRLHQFHKNLIIFAPLFFSNQFLIPSKVVAAVFAVVLFIVLSGVIYIINDLVDREKDTLHPEKKNRPIASGALPPAAAGRAAIILAVLLILAIRWWLPPAFLAVAMVYLTLMVFYCVRGRDLVIIDILLVASGYVLRVFAGVIAVAAPISPWLVICTFFAASILLLGKRYSELKIMEPAAAVRYRPVFAVYNLNLLQQALTINYSCALIAYCLYTISDRTVQVHHSKYLYLTIPFVVYGILRFQYLLEATRLLKEPELFFIRDKASLINIILWLTGFYCLMLLGGAG